MEHNTFGAKTVIGPILCSLVMLVLSSWGISMTKPHCEDSALKSTLTAIAFVGQYFVFGGMAGWLAPSKRLVVGIAIGIVAIPLTSVIWIIALWPPKVFGFLWEIFWAMVPVQYIYAFPLTLFGVFFGAALRKRIQKCKPHVQPIAVSGKGPGSLP